MAAEVCAAGAAGGGGGGSGPEEVLAALLREAESLKQKLEEERQKLNDVTLSSVAERLEPIAFPNLKPRRVLKGHQAKVLCVDWAPDKRHMVTSSQDGKVLVWDAFTATREHTLAMPSTWVMACAYAPSGTLIAAGGLDNKVTVFSVPGEGEEGGASRKRTVATHTSYVSGALFPHTERQLLSASGDGSVALWDVESGALLASYAAHAADVLCVGAAPAAAASDVFASGGADRLLLVWDARLPTPVHAFEGHESDVCGLRFHPGGDALASASDDAWCRAWDLRADRELARFGRAALLFGAADVEWSASGRALFAAYHDHTAVAWDALRGSRLAVLCAHEHRLTRVARSPDGAALATASWDTTVRIWA